MNTLNFLSKTHFKDGRATLGHTKNKRRFRNRLLKLNWSKVRKVYLRVSYGLKTDLYGKKTEYHNDGWYDTSTDLLFAFEAFADED